MDKCQKYFDLLLDGSYLQMSASERRHVEEAMDHNCLQEFIKMKETLNIMSQVSQPDPGQDYWDGYWDRLEEKLDESATNKGILDWPMLLKVAAILFAGIFIGYLIFDTPENRTEVADTTDNDARMITLTQQTSDMLEESKVLLLGIVNLDIPKNDSETIDFSFQKKISGDLLLQTADLKKQLSKTKNRRIVSLLNDLEVILMQIANLENDFDLPAIEMIQQGASRQSLLFKINMERLLMEAKNEHKSDKKNKTKKEL